MFWNLNAKAQGSFKVLEVDHYELIRRMHYVDGLSQRAIALRLGHSRKTVKKALAHAAPLPHKLKGCSRKKPTLLDLSEVEFIASLAIGLLVACAQSLTGQGHRMVILRPQELVERALKSPNVHLLIPITDDHDEALQLLEVV